MAVIDFFKREKVMTIAVILAVVSMFIIPPDAGYADYIDFRVLALLFCLMLLVKGFQEIGLFDLLIHRIFGRVKTARHLCQMLVLLCFFLSMLITNDVSLITFVPFAIMALSLCGKEKLLIPVVVLQTIAANLGSMMTPIGNPQNLYLFTASEMSSSEFFGTMIPLGIVSLVLIMALTMLIPNEPVEIRQDFTETGIDLKSLLVYLGLFVLNLLVVFRILSWIPAIIITTAGILVIGKWKLLTKVDYALLLTFVGFFVFVGNLGRVPQISQAIEDLLHLGVVPVSALFSQFLSNVPAALLLSGFTSDFHGLLIGTNIGGLGTLIASMASLISYKAYATQAENARKGKYLLVFSICNFAGLAILLALTMLISW